MTAVAIPITNTGAPDPGGFVSRPVSAVTDLATGFKNGQFAPLYFFYGEEGWFMDELQRLAVDHAVAPHERDFNLDVVFGPEATAQQVLAQCAVNRVSQEGELIS